MNRLSACLGAAGLSVSALCFAACDSSNFIPGPDPDPAPQLTVSLGADREESARATITLDCTVGNEQGAVVYAWSQVSGPAVSFSDVTVAKPTITLPHVARGATADIEIALSVRDERDEAVSDDILIRVEPVDRLVFRSELRVATMQELGIYDPSTKKTVILSGTVDANRDVLSWSWRPDESVLAFIQSVSGTRNLYVVQPDGSGLVAVTMATTGTGVAEAAWLPDGSRLIYRGDVETVGDVELFSCLPDGTGITKLNDTLPTNADVTRMAIAADSSRVLFSGDAETDGVVELFSVQPDGSGRAKISQALVANGNVTDWSVADSTGRIAYLADAETDAVLELYAVDADGTDHFKLNGTLVSGGVVTSMAWAPDGSRLAYRADQVTNDVFELFSVLPDGTSGTKLNGALVASGDVTSFQWAPSSAFVSYIADQDTDSIGELYAVQSDGTNLAKLNGTMISAGDVSAVFWAPDSGRVAYLADQEVDGQLELYAAGPDGTAQAKLSGTMVANGDVLSASVEWAPDSSRVLFLADRERDRITEVYTATPDGSGLIKLNRAMYRAATQARWAPDSSGVAYLATERSTTPELFYNQPDGSAWRLLNPGIATVIGSANAFRWSPDSKSLAFDGNFTTYFAFDVYTLRIADPESLERCSALPYGARTYEMRWVVDGSSD